MITHSLTIPGWFTAPLAVVMMLAILLHAGATARSRQPASRKRIRLANAGVMFVTLPLLVLGFSVIDHTRQPGVWTLVWMASLGLLAISVGLAVTDMLNTLRLVRRHQRSLRSRLSVARQEAVRETLAGRAGG